MMPSDNHDLFAQSYQDWLNNPVLAFHSWLNRQDLKSNSATVYHAMWRKFIEWTASKEIAFAQIEARHIAWFLDENGLQKHHRYRYIRLIERVFEHLASLRPWQENPASIAAQQRVGLGENDPTSFLTFAERDALMAFLQPAPQATTTAAYWKAMRDRALVAVMLGGGLKVFELQQLKTTDIDLHQHTIQIIDETRQRTRHLTLLQFAHQPLQDWLTLRHDSATAGLFVFASNRKGGMMHAASFFRRTQAILEQIELFSQRHERASPQTLRNTFAALHYDQGVDDRTVAEWLGLIEPASARRFYLAYRDWQQRHLVAGTQTPTLP
ncbi:tyrosine-type recombinase/integrase [Aquaspirillum soli]